MSDNKPTFPPKPWLDKDKQFLIPGMEFIYNASLNKWIPLTPDGSYTQKQLDIVADAVNLDEKIDILISNIGAYSNIHKGAIAPLKELADPSDLFYNINNGKLYAYVESVDSWVQVLE